jgi:Ca-activated chloride channel family protein
MEKLTGEHIRWLPLCSGFVTIRKKAGSIRSVLSMLIIVASALMLACGKSEIIPSRKTASEKAVEAKLAPSAAKKMDTLGRVREFDTGDQEYHRFNTEEYSRIYENTFLEVKNNPLSTFSIDVDTASYSNIRRFINRNSLPPKDAVRIEEMINYFTYEYPQPEDKHPFSIITEISSSPWNPSYRLVHIGLQGKKLTLDKMPPSNLVFLLDVSGSMDSPDKLPLLKTAFKLLVNQMRSEDRIAIVVYAGAAGLILPSTPGSQKSRIIAAIDKLYAGGSTAGGMGIKLAYQIAKENYLRNGNNRVILATDGDFNVGVSSTSELVRLVENKRRDGIFLTVLGFGTGNYKDSRMESLADKGNGNYAYIDSILEAKKVLVREMGGTLFTIAKDVKIQVEFNPALVKAYRLIGYENRMLKSEDFNDDKKDAGELGSGHSVTALYEIIPKGTSADLPDIDPLKYQETRIRENAQRSKEIMTVKLRYKKPGESESRLIVKPVQDQNTSIDKTTHNFRFSAAVAEFGMLLRDSKFKGNASYASSIELAKRSIGKDDEGYRAEFIRLIKMARALSGE